MHIASASSKTFSQISDFLDTPYDTIIDVRTPSEYAEDHIPGAVNYPVLSDEERARVGTIYVQQSPFLARKVGGALVARNAAKHIDESLAEKSGAWQPLVYCWRGGQRSQSFASILAQIGWRTQVVEGGYKCWRRLVVKALYDASLPHRLVLLDGNTGTAKTDILNRVAARGGQVLDLEGLAHHRGSIFGASGTQPSQKGFESALAQALSRLDPNVPTLVEAESSRIGARAIPSALWSAMCAAPRVEVKAPLPARAAYLAVAYADIAKDTPALERLLAELVVPHGHETVELWQNMARTGAYEGLAQALMAQHYDPRYAKSRSRYAPEYKEIIEMNALAAQDIDAAAQAVQAAMSSPV